MLIVFMVSLFGFLDQMSYRAGGNQDFWDWGGIGERRKGRGRWAVVSGQWSVVSGQLNGG